MMHGVTQNGFWLDFANTFIIKTLSNKKNIKNVNKRGENKNVETFFICGCENVR